MKLCFCIYMILTSFLPEWKDDRMREFTAASSPINCLYVWSFVHSSTGLWSLGNAAPHGHSAHLCSRSEETTPPCNIHQKQEEIRLKNTTILTQQLISADSDAKLMGDTTAARPSVQPPWDQVAGTDVQDKNTAEHHPPPCHVHSPQPHRIPRAALPVAPTSLEQRGRSAEPHGCEMLMLQTQSTEGSSAQRDLAGSRLRGTKAKGKWSLLQKEWGGHQWMANIGWKIH